MNNKSSMIKFRLKVEQSHTKVEKYNILEIWHICNLQIIKEEELG